MNPISAAKIRDLLPRTDAVEFSADIYHKTGFFVLRHALQIDQVLAWQGMWNRFYAETLAADRVVNPFNPAVVNESAPESLATIHRNPALLDLAEQVHGPDIALHFQRFLIKDRQSRTSIFLHHDYAYNYGWPHKTTIFIPLSRVGAENGGLTFYPGTQYYGYLGDAGEIDPGMIGADWPAVTPQVNPGDVILMHCCTWHASLPHCGGPDRVIAQAVYQPANDPSGIALLRGQWRTDFLFKDMPCQNFFKRSRVSRLLELQAEVDQLQFRKKKRA